MAYLDGANTSNYVKRVLLPTFFLLLRGPIAGMPHGIKSPNHRNHWPWASPQIESGHHTVVF